MIENTLPFIVDLTFEYKEQIWIKNTLLFIVDQVSRDKTFFFFFFLEKQTHTHTKGREKEVLTQRHTTTPLKSHGNF